MRFSQRQGYKEIKTVLQLDAMDSDLKFGLWNVLDTILWNKVKYNDYTSQNSIFSMLLKDIWSDFFKIPIDTMPVTVRESVLKLRHYYMEVAKWYEIYDLIEFILNRYQGSKGISYHFNQILERELSGYRFIDEILTPITSDIETDEILQSLNRENRFSGVTEHIKRALNMLSDRKSPDYRNSIKESISAVESLCKVITGNSKSTLGEALKKFEINGLTLHPSLKEAFSKLYGYTSDEKGIRHSLIDGNANVSFDEAKYMLVICCGFVNYLISKYKA